MEYNTLSGGTVVPDVDNLQRDAILESMLEHISDYRRKDTSVKVETLKQSVLKPVLNAPIPDNGVYFNQEKQLRGFLRAFENTLAYSSEFKILDERTQAQIETFKDEPDTWKDKRIWQDTEKKGFRLPDINPEVSHVLATAASAPTSQSGIKRLLFSAFVKVARPLALLFVKLRLRKAAKKLEKQEASKYAHGPCIYEHKDVKHSKPMTVYTNLPFENWGQSVQNTPKYTFVPTTVLGIENLVKFANQKNFQVRCGGYRHSWSRTFSQDQEIFISLLPVVQVTRLPDPMSILPMGHSAEETDLNKIELVESPKNVSADNSKKTTWCRLGVAVTNEDFRRWAIKHKQWALPVDVILVEVTIGGVNGPICHGAGARHGTINDFVKKVEYVDANGKSRTISEPEHLKAAAGCFGLLGVVTHITFELDEMTYAILKPRKVPVAEAIPPLKRDDIPPALRTTQYDDITSDKLDKWKKKFALRAAEDYYSEWFWFTYQKRVWVNTWNKTSDPSGATGYPDAEDTFFQWLQGWLGGIVSANPFFQALPGAWQAQMLATLSMTVLPPTDGEDNTPTYKTLLPDALHFRRGVQNMRVRDMEFQIPIPDLPNPSNPDLPGEPDWSVVQRAWWDVINLVYELANRPPPRGFRQRILRFLGRQPLSDRSRTPMRLTLELRIMGGSSLLMAPQAGNKRTASIEVLTVLDAHHDGEWEDFMQRVSDKWMSYTDNNKMRLNVRPHWAKEWESLRMNPDGPQVAAREYLRTKSYKEAIDKFKWTLSEIGKKQGWTLEQIRNRFSNELWDQIVYS